MKKKKKKLTLYKHDCMLHHQPSPKVQTASHPLFQAVIQAQKLYNYLLIVIA